MLKAIQGKLRDSGAGLGLLSLKAGTGLFVGLTFALIFRQLMGVGSFLFIFTIVIFGVIFLKISQKWKFSGVLLFDLFCVMTAMLLRMYILIAPGE
jgi:hypothetical protein